MRFLGDYREAPADAPSPPLLPIFGPVSVGVDVPPPSPAP
jgi:hypothetical protein